MGAWGRLIALLLIVVLPAPLSAQEFRLSRCRVVTAEGSLVKLSCGGETFWVVGRELASECAAFKRNCPAWQERSLLLDGALLELQRGEVLLTEATAAADTYQAQIETLNIEVSELQDQTLHQWTTLEVVGVAAIVLVGAFVGGAVVGVFAL